MTSILVRSWDTEGGLGMTTDSQREDGRVMTEPDIGVMRPRPEAGRGVEQTLPWSLWKEPALPTL